MALIYGLFKDTYTCAATKPLCCAFKRVFDLNAHGATFKERLFCITILQSVHKRHIVCYQWHSSWHKQLDSTIAKDSLNFKHIHILNITRISADSSSNCFSRNEYQTTSTNLSHRPSQNYRRARRAISPRHTRGF